MRPLLRVVLLASLVVFLYGLVARAPARPLPLLLLGIYALGSGALKLAYASALALERMERLGLRPAHLPDLERAERLGAWPVLVLGALSLVLAIV